MSRALILLALVLSGPAQAAERWGLSPDGKHWEMIDPDYGQWRLNPGHNDWTFTYPGEQPRLDPDGRWRWTYPDR
jgi:hypothetical protein